MQLALLERQTVVKKREELRTVKAREECFVTPGQRSHPMGRSCVLALGLTDDLLIQYLIGLHRHDIELCKATTGGHVASWTSGMPQQDCIPWHVAWFDSGRVQRERPVVEDI